MGLVVFIVGLVVIFGFILLADAVSKASAEPDGPPLKERFVENVVILVCAVALIGAVGGLYWGINAVGGGGDDSDTVVSCSENPYRNGCPEDIRIKQDAQIVNEGIEAEQEVRSWGP